MKAKRVGGDEQDAFSKMRRKLHWQRGALKKIKRKFWKRQRKGIDMRILIILLCAASLGGCASSAMELERQARDARQDDHVCRSFMKNKAASDDTTYAECRQNLVDFANMAPMGVAPQPNITVIVNQ